MDSKLFFKHNEKILYELSSSVHKPFCFEGQSVRSFVAQKGIMTMAKMIQLPYDYQIVLPGQTAQAVQKNNNENPISLEALGLLVNLLSYPTTWELHKTELYKRFGQNGERSVKRAWDDLMGSNYIIEFKYRSGKKWEYVYYFRKVPFTNDEKANILKDAEKEYGAIHSLEFGDCILKSSKRRGNQKTLSNKNPILNNNVENNSINDDDKRTQGSASHNEEEISLIISNFRQATDGEITDRSFNAVVRKVMDKYNQGKVNSFRDYLATALITKIEELEFRRMKDKAKESLKESASKRQQQRASQLYSDELNHKIVRYNWLEQ